MSEVRRQSMKVVHLSSAHFADDTRIFHRECRTLCEAGYSVTLILPHDKDQTVDDVYIKAVPLLTSRLARVTSTLWRVFCESVRQKAHIYHFHDFELILVGLLLRALGKKVIYDIHEDFPQSAIFARNYIPRLNCRPLAWVVECGEKIAARLFSALVPATPAIAARFRGLNSNIVVVHNFPSIAQFKEMPQVPWQTRAFAVTYVGSIFPERGIHQLLAAMALLPETMTASLHLVGDFSPPTFRRDLANLPGWNRVQAVGHVNQKDIPLVLEHVRAGLAVLPPLPRFKVGYPVKMFEYMAAGIPVIASDFPLWREIIGDVNCGLLVDPLDPQSIAKAIHYILTHSEEAEAMGRRGQAAAQEFYSWETEEQKLLRLYASLEQPINDAVEGQRTYIPQR